MDTPPPVSPLDISLPFDSPKFDDIDFENLCAELLKAEFGVDFYRYGMKGNSQYGIDLLSEEDYDGYFIAVQCKKVKRFSIADIKKELDKFIKGTLPVKHLLFVVSCDISAVTRDFIYTQKINILGRNSKIDVWNKEFLSRKIKSYPVLVGSYFGLEWRRHLFPHLNEDFERERADKLTEQLIKLKREHSLLATRMQDDQQNLAKAKIELKPILEGYFKDKDGVAQLHGYCHSLRGFSFRYSVSFDFQKNGVAKMATSMVSIVLSPEDAVDLESVLVRDLYRPASVSTYYAHDVYLTHIDGETPFISFLSRDFSFQFPRNTDYHQLLALVEDYLNNYADMALFSRRYRSLKESLVEINTPGLSVTFDPSVHKTT